MATDKGHIMSYKVIHFQDDIYQLVENNSEYIRNVMMQGTLTEINAYISLEEKGLL